MSRWFCFQWGGVGGPAMAGHGQFNATSSCFTCDKIKAAFDISVVMAGSCEWWVFLKFLRIEYKNKSSDMLGQVHLPNILSLTMF